MNRTRALPLVLTVAVAAALLNASGAAYDSPQARITDIGLRVSAKATSLVIELSEPAPYVATRPDPVTIILEFRNTSAKETVHSVAKSVRESIAAVYVEASETGAGSIARVRIALAQPLGYHVRSDRNRIIVDLDRPVPGQALPPAARARQAVDPIAALGLDGTLSAPANGQSGPSAPPAPSAAPSAPAAAPGTITTLDLPKTPPPVLPTNSLAQAAPNALRLGTALRQAAPAAGAPQPTMTTIGTGQPNERQYTGHPISLDFQGADLRAVLRTFAEISGLNIVIDPKVNGTVDVALRDVPWDQALDNILRANSLGYVVNGTIVRVAPLDALEAEQKKLSDLAKAQAEAGQITTLTRQLSYAKGEEIVALLKSTNVMSQRGSAYVDPRTNTLIMTDLADRLQTTNQLITTLDTPQPQVEIEARIVQTNKTYAREIGVQWGFQGRVDPALGNTTPLAFPNNGNLGGRTAGEPGSGGLQGRTAGTASTLVPTAVNLPVPGATSAIGLALGSVNGAFNLDIALSALEKSNNGKVLSSPRVTTQNNVSAEIAQGVQIPYQTTANNTTTTQFKDAALILRVTPQITAANTVIMTIAVDNGSVDQLLTTPSGVVPVIRTQRANTSVLVNNGETTVLGGIYVNSEQNTNDKTPGLNRLPLLGWLFKHDALKDDSSELLIFITPRIIKG